MKTRKIYLIAFIVIIGLIVWGQSGCTEAPTVVEYPDWSVERVDQLIMEHKREIALLTSDVKVLEAEVCRETKLFNVSQASLRCHREWIKYQGLTLPAECTGHSIDLTECL